jgi:hypothetical protein
MKSLLGIDEKLRRSIVPVISVDPLAIILVPSSVHYLGK